MRKDLLYISGSMLLFGTAGVAAEHNMLIGFLFGMAVYTLTFVGIMRLIS